jgi:hypothetical protein
VVLLREIKEPTSQHRLLIMTLQRTSCGGWGTSMPDATTYDSLLSQYGDAKHNLRIFMEGVASYIGSHPQLTVGGQEIIPSYKSRLKDREHLRDKIAKKVALGRVINEENLFCR